MAIRSRAMRSTSRRLEPCRGLSGVAALLMFALATSAFAAGPDTSKAKAGKGKDAATEKPSLIDEMLQDSWKSAKVKPSPLASDAEFMRRAYLDLLGRIPNIQEASAFLDTKEPGKRA